MGWCRKRCCVIGHLYIGSKHPLTGICGLIENPWFNLWILFYILNIRMCYLISNKITEFSDLYHLFTKFKKWIKCWPLLTTDLSMRLFFLFLASNRAWLYFMATSWFSIATLQLFKGSVVKQALRNTAIRCRFYRCMFKEVGLREQNACSYSDSFHKKLWDTILILRIMAGAE